jgi:flotillin
MKKAVAAEKVQQAKALKEAYEAEKQAEMARAEREKATQKANIVVTAEIEKEKAIIDAEAEAETYRRKARGEADAIFAKMEAEGKGIYEILSKQAEGYKQLVQAAGGDTKNAVTYLIAEKLPELVKTQVEAIRNLKIDKIMVWDGNNAKGEKTTTANFVSGLMNSVPPLNDLFNMAGMKLPDYLGKENNKEGTKDEADTLKKETKKLDEKANKNQEK